MTPATVLILGANGRLGAAAAQAFADAGWRVLAQARRPLAAVHPRIEPLAIAATDTTAIAAAAAGASVVVHALNPVYTRWAAEALPLARAGMDIAQALGAAFMLPGNVYAYGSAMPARLAEDTPELPDTRKGRIRARIEAEMRERAAQGLRAVVIRAGDFYGGGPGSWFDEVIVKGLATGRLVYPGPLDRPHAWAYLPDLAQAFVAVAARGVPAGFTALHFEGHTLSGTELLALVEAAAGELGLAPARGFRRAGLPWALLRLGGLVVPMWRELAEMAYLWQRPHALAGERLRAFAGPLPATPPAQAIARSLRALGFGRVPPRPVPSPAR